jgi:hypothetical protein
LSDIFHPMKRRLFRIVAGASLALWVAVVSVWAAGGWKDNLRRTHFVPLLHRWEYMTDGAVRPFGWRSIWVAVLHSASTPIVGPAWSPNGESTPELDAWLSQYRPYHRVECLGFLVEYGPELGGVMGGPAEVYGSRIDLTAPYWGLAILLLILPIAAWAEQPLARRWLQRRNRLRLVEQGLVCGKCGYDLRATPERCPECGTVVAKRAAICSAGEESPT